MDWINIERKWHEMETRMQGVSSFAMKAKIAGTDPFAAPKSPGFANPNTLPSPAALAQSDASDLPKNITDTTA